MFQFRKTTTMATNDMINEQQTANEWDDGWPDEEVITINKYFVLCNMSIQSKHI